LFCFGKRIFDQEVFMSAVVISPRLPAHLLAPYVENAAHEVLRGEPLSERSRQAVVTAIRQLRGERAAIDASIATGTDKLAAEATATGSSLELAVLVLDTASSDRGNSSNTLGQLVNELERLESGDHDAAQVVADAFAEIGDRLFSESDSIDVA
jgi:hypothetical protein